MLQDRTVLITGGGGGIGRGIALACGHQGANVVIAARRLETGGAVADEIVRRGGCAIAVHGDVTSRDDVETAVDTAVLEFGGLDSLIHNALADIGPPHAVEEVPDEMWNAMLSSGIRASFYCAQAAFRELRRRAGNLIFITSAVGVEGSPYIPAYAVVKGAQRGLAKCLAREWGPLGIRVNCIAPLARTPMMERNAAKIPTLTEGRALGRVSMGYIGDPERDIGPVAAFFASDLARYVTGQTINADGGAFTP